MPRAVEISTSLQIFVEKRFLWNFEAFQFLFCVHNFISREPIEAFPKRAFALKVVLMWAQIWPGEYGAHGKILYLPVKKPPIFGRYKLQKVPL